MLSEFLNNCFSVYFKKILFKKKAAIGFTVLVTTLVIALATQLSKIQTHYSLDQFQPKNHQSLEEGQKVRQKFLVSDLSPFIVSLELSPGESWLDPANIETVQDFTDTLYEHELVESIQSITSVPLAIVTEDTFSVGTLDEVPEEERQSSNKELLIPQLLSNDYRSTTIVITPASSKTSDKQELYSFIQGKLKTMPGQVTVMMGGPSTITTRMTELLSDELSLFILLSLVLSGLALFVVFKGFQAPLVCFTLVTVAISSALSIIAVVGMPFTILSNTVPVIISITVIAIVCHSLIRLSEDLTHCHEAFRQNALKQAFLFLLKPHLLTGVTTVIGFSTLIPSDVPVIRDFGISVVLGIIVALTMTLFLLPLFYTFLNPPQKRFSEISFGFISENLGPWSRPVAMMFAMVAFLFFGSFWNLEWSSRLFDDLPNGDSSKTASLFIDKNLGGTLPLDVVISGHKEDFWMAPGNIGKMDDLLGEVRADASVGSAMGLADFFKVSEASGVIPDDSKRISEKFLLYGMSSDNPLEFFVTPNKKSARLALRMKDRPSGEMFGSVTQIKQLVNKHFPTAKVSITGVALSTHVINQEVSHKLMMGFFFALFWIFLLLTVVYSSLRWALFSVIPNLMPPAVLISALALSQTPIKPGIAIIFSISLGIAFDNTVYILNGLKKYMEKGLDMNSALQKTIGTEFEACALSGLCLASGFSSFLLSQFSINQTFGVFMLLSIASGLVGDLILLPVLIRLCPGFLTGKTTKEVIEAPQPETSQEGVPNVA